MFIVNNEKLYTTSTGKTKTKMKFSHKVHAEDIGVQSSDLYPTSIL